MNVSGEEHDACGQAAAGVDPIAPIVVAAEVIREGRHQRLIGFAIAFSMDMNVESAISAVNYSLTELMDDGTPVVSRRVPVEAVYETATRVVTLVWQGAHAFELGGSLAITGQPPAGLASVSGVFLGGAGAREPGTDAHLTVLPGASGVVIG